MEIKMKEVIVLSVLMLIQAGYCKPQGFFSGFSIPKLVSWNNNEKSLDILPSVKVASPVKSSHVNIFGKKTTDDNKISNYPQPNYQQQFESNNANQPYPVEANQGSKQRKDNAIQGTQLPNNFNYGQLVSKFNAVDDFSSKQNKIETTTEFILETTTDDYETTTFEEDVFNRASPQLVASLLG